jgi:hypothetical protein
MILAAGRIPFHFRISIFQFLAKNLINFLKNVKDDLHPAPLNGGICAGPRENLKFGHPHKQSFGWHDDRGYAMK